MEEFIEKRQHPRVEVRWPIRISTDDNIIEGETNNISLDGISICCDEPLPLNQIFEISIEPHDHHIIVFSGKVIWADVYGLSDETTTYGMGICFVSISDEDRDRYEDLVSVFL